MLAQMAALQEYLVRDQMDLGLLVSARQGSADRAMNSRCV